MGKDHSDGANGYMFCGGADPRKIITGTLTMPSSYATGGADLDLSSEFKGGSFRIFFNIFPVTATIASVAYDYTNKKVLAYVAAGTEVAAETDIDALTVEYMAIGLAD